MTSTALHRPGTSPVHRLPAQVKVVAAFTAVLAVVATPREAFWVFGTDLVVLAGIWAVAGVPAGWLARRALIEVPFVLLAAVLPFTGSGPRTEVLGVSVSVDGALAGWNILAKGTLGVLVSLTLAATTHPNDIVVGMQRLRVPQVVTTIASLMLRYIDVIVAEARRMHTARVCRGHDPRFLWQVGAVARGIGVLFLRSYERGERVHLAMLARGWTGAMPASTATPAGIAGWLTGLSPALVVAVLAGVGLWTT